MQSLYRSAKNYSIPIVLDKSKKQGNETFLPAF